MQQCTKSTTISFKTKRKGNRNKLSTYWWLVCSSSPSQCLVLPCYRRCLVGQMQRSSTQAGNFRLLCITRSLCRRFSTISWTHYLTICGTRLRCHQRCHWDDQPIGDALGFLPCSGKPIIASLNFNNRCWYCFQGGEGIKAIDGSSVSTPWSRSHCEFAWSCQRLYS